jgi:hypothetical protein
MAHGIGSWALVWLHLLLLRVLALPDYTCICEKYNINGCSRTYSCRLNQSISFGSPPVPTWVTDKETTLFAETIEQAKNGSLRPPIFDLGRLTWEARLACDDDVGGRKRWHLSNIGCNVPAVNTTVVGTSRLTGWASLGFHPLGTAGGTWLTQILGQVNNPDGDPSFLNARCANTGLFINLTYINATEPYDPRFSPNGFWGTLLRSRTYPVGSDGVPSYRTDRDMIANGVNLNCSSYDQTGLVCKSPQCLEPPLVSHYACPATNSGYVGSLNCSRTYSESSASSRSSRHELIMGVLSAVAISGAFLIFGG